MASEAEGLLLKGDQAAGAMELMSQAQDLAREAISLYRKADAENSRDAAVLVDYGDALKLVGDLDLAARAYASAARQAPSNAQYWLKLGKTRDLLGPAHVKPTLEALERCIQSSALDGEAELIAQAHSARGDVYWKVQLYDLAERAYGQSLAAISDYAPARLALAALYTRRGEVLKASTEIEAVGALDRRAGMLLSQRLTEALGHMQRDRRTFGDTAEEHLAYAKVLSRVGMSPQILGALERSIALDDKNYVAWNLLGSLTSQTGDVDRAWFAFARSLELKPDQPFTKRALDALAARRAAGEKRD